MRLDADAGTEEFTINGIAYYSDDHLQSYLDRHRSDHQRELLAVEQEYNNGTVEWHNYRFKEHDVERAGSGTQYWRVENHAGSAIGTADYSVDYDGRLIRFTADQEGERYYLTYRSFDYAWAVSEIWGHKSSNVARRFDVETDNHTLKFSQLKTTYAGKEQEWKRKRKLKNIRLTRVDVL
jgi:hypothetical protein